MSDFLSYDSRYDTGIWDLIHDPYVSLTFSISGTGKPQI